MKVLLVNNKLVLETETDAETKYLKENPGLSEEMESKWGVADSVLKCVEVECNNLIAEWQENFSTKTVPTESKIHIFRNGELIDPEEKTNPTAKQAANRVQPHVAAQEISKLELKPGMLFTSNGVDIWEINIEPHLTVKNLKTAKKEKMTLSSFNERGFKELVPKG